MPVNVIQKQRMHRAAKNGHHVVITHFGRWKSQNAHVEPGADAEAGADAGAEAGAGDVAPEDRAAQAEAALPAEPPVDDPTGCSVAVRLPDGSRVTRRFPRSAPLAALYDFCVSRCGEAATGRPFSLCPALHACFSMPGGAALHNRATSLEDAGVAGQCLRLAWSAP